MGNGMLQYTEVQPNKLIKYELSFEVAEENSVGYFAFEPVEEGVRVTWVDKSSMSESPLQRYMGLFKEAIIGSDIDQGLANVKAVCE